MQIKSDWYLLDDQGNPVPTDDMDAWGEFMRDATQRTVGKTKIGKTEVSTVFLGMDHNFTGSGDPVLWETCIFHENESEVVGRYESAVEAELGHAQWCERMEIEQLGRE